MLIDNSSANRMQSNICLTENSLQVKHCIFCSLRFSLISNQCLFFFVFSLNLFYLLSLFILFYSCLSSSVSILSNYFSFFICLLIWISTFSCSAVFYYLAIVIPFIHFLFTVITASFSWISFRRFLLNTDFIPSFIWLILFHKFFILPFFFLLILIIIYSLSSLPSIFHKKFLLAFILHILFIFFFNFLLQIFILQTQTLPNSLFFLLPFKPVLLNIYSSIFFSFPTCLLSWHKRKSLLKKQKKAKTKILNKLIFIARNILCFDLTHGSVITKRIAYRANNVFRFHLIIFLFPH